MTYMRSVALTLSILAVAVALAACGGPGSDGTAPLEGSYTLAVATEGPGSVEIVELDETCSGTCEYQVGAGVELELRALPAEGKGFMGWEQACSGNDACSLDMTEDRSVRAIFADHALALDIRGDGGASVRIVPPDRTCSDDCVEAYTVPVSVSLSVTLDEGSRVDGWEGSCSSSGTRRYCQLEVDGLRNVALVVVRPPVAEPDAYDVEEGRTLTVGAAEGVLRNDTDSAGDTLSAVLVEGPSNGTLELAANGSFTYQPNGLFSGSDGFTYRARDEAGNLSEPVAVSIAVRERASHTLTVVMNGNGRVTSSPGGIDCPGDCNHPYDEGTMVTLTATAGIGARFTGWGGACAGVSGTTCTVTMDAAKGVEASFALVSFRLSYTRQGEGTGTVTLQPPGIDCNLSCEQDYEYGTTVEVQARPADGSTFEGWSGCDSTTGTNGTVCIVQMTESRAISATFGAVPPAAFHALSVSVSGNGSVGSSPGGIDCPGDCTENYEEGTLVSLSATPADGSRFAGWGGACAGTTGTTCTVTMDAAKGVEASFELASFRLAYTRQGSGTGTVTLQPPGVDCTDSCQQVYQYGTTVEATAAPAGDGSTFEGWSGCDSTTGTNGTVCTVAMTADRAISATFGPPPAAAAYTLAATPTGDGGGTVTIEPGGLACSSPCSNDFPEGTEVTATAEPDPDSSFSGWSGCDDVTGGVCSLTMTSDRSITASFSLTEPEPATYALSLGIAGDGSGSVASDPPGIDCSDDCSAQFEEGTAVMLTATPDAGSLFQGWEGDCAAAGAGTCDLVMDAPRSATAVFALEPAEEGGEDTMTDDESESASTGRSADG